MMKRYSEAAGTEGSVIEATDGEYILYVDHAEAMKRIAGAPVAQGLTEPQMAMLHALLVAIRPEYGTPGSRDVEVGRQQKRIDAALAILAQAAPSASAQQAVAWAEPTLHECVPAGHPAADSCVFTVPLYAAPAPVASPEQHPDDVAVDMFAKAMKGKLAQARAKGRSGWQTCNKYELSNMLRDHVEKGDPRDVANFCMFLHALGHPIQIAPSASPWVSINPAATLADRLDELPEINFSNYDQGDVEALQAWAIEAYTLLNASPAPTNVKKEG